MDQAVKKSAGGDDHRRSVQFFPQRGFYSANPTMIKKQAVGGGLANLQIFLVFQHRFHPQAIAQAISLGSRGSHRRPLAGIELTKLNGGSVDIAGHFPAQSIDLLNQMPLGQATHRRVAT